LSFTAQSLDLELLLKTLVRPRVETSLYLRR